MCFYLDENEYTSKENLNILKQLTNILNEKDEAIKKSERILRAILESSPIGIALIDKWKIIWSNQSMSSTFGYTEEELSGMSMKSLCPGQDEYIRIGEEIYKKRFEGNEKGEIRARLIKKDRTVFDALIRVSFVSENSELMKYMKDPDLMVIAIVIDLEELKSLCEGHLYSGD